LRDARLNVLESWVVDLLGDSVKAHRAAAVLLVVMCAAGCAGEGDTPSPVSDADMAEFLGTVQVTYRLSGTVDWADVTMETPTGTDQFTPDIPLMTNSGELGLTKD